MNEEDAIQIAAAALLNSLRIMWTHVPNGEKRPPGVGRKLKRMGVSRGVPDVLCFDVTLDGEVGFALEIKTACGRLSPHQSRWLAGLDARGWRTRVAYGIDEALCEIRAAYGNTPRPRVVVHEESEACEDGLIDSLFGDQ